MIREDTLQVLRCPVCDGLEIIHNIGKKSLSCTKCKRDYPITDDEIIQMVVPSDKPIPEMYSDPDYLRYQEVQTHILTGIYDKPVLHRVQHSGHKQITEWFSTQPDVEWIVDIGCGDGAHYEYIEKRESVIGIERDIESLQKIREKYPQPMLIQADACNLPIKSEKIDIAFSIYILEHIYNLEDALSEVSRILNVSSSYYVGLPCEGGLVWGMGRKFTTERIFSKRFNSDYGKAVKIEHCSTAKKVVDALKKEFTLVKHRLFPFNFLPFIACNLILTMQLTKKTCT